MVSGIEGLRDIHGIPGVPWWPPAPGWWLVAAGLLGLLSALWYWRKAIWLRIPPIPVFRLGTWRWDAARQLRDLRRRAGKQPPKQTAGELSELIRRIAMARFGRSACAGLTGEPWLAWLKEQDPNEFDWTQQGKVLLEMPYAPPGTDAQKKALYQLMEALHAWIAAEDPDV